MGYQRFVSYGLGHKGRKSQTFERRSEQSFRKWMRRKLKGDLQQLDQDGRPMPAPDTQGHDERH